MVQKHCFPTTKISNFEHELAIKLKFGEFVPYIICNVHVK